jgi:hypothetical protein
MNHGLRYARFEPCKPEEPMEQQDLGPPVPMQIRSVPERVRDFFNDMARDEGRITLGELMTRIATGATVVTTTVDGRSVDAVQTVVAASRAPLNMAALAQAAQALLHVSQASGKPIPARTAGSLSAAIAAEVRRMRGLPTPNRTVLLGSADQA